MHQEKSTTCKNCEYTFVGNFCNHCGQSADTHRMNFHFVLHDIQHGLLHVDKGVFYTIKELFTRPGNSIREYIEGKRVKHFKPVSMIVLLATIYGFLSLYFNVGMMDIPSGIVDSNDKSAALFEKINDWSKSHYVGYTLFILPFLSLSSFLVFKDQRYNLVEHFVVNAFITAQMLVVQLLFFPITYFTHGTLMGMGATSIITLLSLMLTVWTYVQFFNKISTLRATLMAILSYTLMLVLVTILSMVVVVFYFVLYGHLK